MIFNVKFLEADWNLESFYLKYVFFDARIYQNEKKWILFGFFSEF